MVPGTGIEPVQAFHPQDFKSCASTNSAIPAPCGTEYIKSISSCQNKMNAKMKIILRKLSVG